MKRIYFLLLLLLLLLSTSQFINVMNIDNFLLRVKMALCHFDSHEMKGHWLCLYEFVHMGVCKYFVRPLTAGHKKKLC